MNVQEVYDVINALKNLKHKTLIILLYSTGMRLSEITNLKIADIDRSTIKIIGAHDESDKKGGYKANDYGVKELLTYFDSQFLPELETKENIKITPICI